VKPITSRSIASIAFAITGFIAANAAFSGPMGYRGEGAAFTEERVERMTENLDLTADQQVQIRTILDEQRTERDLLRQKTQLRIDAVLTDTQRAERDRLIEDRIDKRLDRIAQRLDLTNDQTDEIHTILQERLTNPQLTRSEIKERISAVLTNEQREKFWAMAERRGPGRAGGRGPGF